MKVTFVYKAFESLGIEYLSAVLKKAGHKTFLVYEPGLFDTFHLVNKRMDRLYTNEQGIVEKVLDTSPDIIAFSVVYDDYNWVCKIAEAIKRKNGGIPIIFGGIHPTCVPEEVILQSFVDYVCVGEGEEAFLELVDALEQGKDTEKINNIWTKRNGEVISNGLRPLIQDLNTLPFPDKDIFHNIYKGFSRDHYYIVTSRRCPCNCSFCYSSYLRKIYSNRGKYLLRRRVDNVIEEFKWAREKYNIKFVTFFDDILVYDKIWLRDFAERYREEIGLPCYCFVHPGYIDEEVVSLLSKMSCGTANMGIQTISENIRRKVLNRTETNEDIKRAIALFEKSKIFLYVDIIIGLPGQDKEELIRTAQFLNLYRPDAVFVYWLAFFPKFEITTKMAERTGRVLIKNSNNPGNTLLRTTYNPKLPRLGTFIMISCVLPRGIFNFMIRLRLYNVLHRLVYTHSLTNWLFLYFVVLAKKIFQSKGQSILYSYKVKIEDYKFFICKKLFKR